MILRRTQSQNPRCDLPAEVEVICDGSIATMGFRRFCAGGFDCNAQFDTQDDVVSHAHGARHRVESADLVAYTNVPAELLKGVR